MLGDDSGLVAFECTFSKHVILSRKTNFLHVTVSSSFQSKPMLNIQQTSVCCAGLFWHNINSNSRTDRLVSSELFAPKPVLLNNNYVELYVICQFTVYFHPELESCLGSKTNNNLGKWFNLYSHWGFFQLDQ